MWYLNRGDRLDMNVQGAWLEGVTGKGVSITILDDGVERSHPDLQAAFMKIMFLLWFLFNLKIDLKFIKSWSTHHYLLRR